jgi:hypothetical protein
VEIPGFTFPVTQCFLEDAIEATGVDLRETNRDNEQGGSVAWTIHCYSMDVDCLEIRVGGGECVG